MKFFGHPVHVMLIHFPAALLPMDLVCYFLQYYTGLATFGATSFYAMMGGVAVGWLAIISGALDLVNLQQDKPVVMRSALIHGSINGVVIIIYTVLAFATFKKYPEFTQATLIFLITKAALVCLMFGGNYIGGNLILKYKVGIQNKYSND